MDSILTVLIVVVVIQFVWLIVIQRKLTILVQKGAPGCCDRVKHLYDWINGTLLPALNCIQESSIDPACKGGSPDPWPPKGPGGF